MPNGLAQCIEPYENLYSDAYQNLSSIYIINPPRYIVHVAHQVEESISKQRVDINIIEVLTGQLVQK